MKDEEVVIKLEFDFELAEDKNREWGDLQWAVQAVPTSHLYISANHEKLLEVINKTSALIYQAEEVPHDATHRKVVWKKLHYIERFPYLLQGVSSVNFLFSCNYNYYLDYNFKAN